MALTDCPVLTMTCPHHSSACGVVGKPTKQAKQCLYVQQLRGTARSGLAIFKLIGAKLGADLDHHFQIQREYGSDEELQRWIAEWRSQLEERRDSETSSD